MKTTTPNSNSKMQLIKDFAEKGLELEVPEKFVENDIHVHKKCWDSMRYEVKKIPKRDHSVGPSELANAPSAKRRLVLADNVAEESVTKYKCSIIQTEQNTTNRDKIQKFQNTNMINQKNKIQITKIQM